MNKTDLKERALHGTPDFPIAIYNNTFDKEYNLLAPLHYHSEFELLVATKGTVTVRIEDTIYNLAEGEGIFINSELLHVITSEENMNHGFVAIVFDYKFLCSESEVTFTKYIHPLINGSYLPPLYLTKEMLALVFSICNAYRSQAFGFELYIKCSLIKIIHLLLKDTTTSSLPVENSKSILTKKIIRYMENNFSEQITLQDMADYVHISKEYLCRIFHVMSNTSPIEYLNRYRIRQSASLLMHSNKSISEVAFACGFNNSSYFNKLFLRYMGCTPREYRKSQR